MVEPDPNLTLLGYGAVLLGWGVVSIFLSGVSLLLWGHLGKEK